MLKSTTVQFRRNLHKVISFTPNVAVKFQYVARAKSFKRCSIFLTKFKQANLFLSSTDRIIQMDAPNFSYVKQYDWYHICWCQQMCFNDYDRIVHFAVKLQYLNYTLFVLEWHVFNHSSKRCMENNIPLRHKNLSNYDGCRPLHTCFKVKKKVLFK